MGLPKHKTRRIVVDGQTFRWCESSEPFALLVQSEQGQGQRLSVVLPWDNPNLTVKGVSRPLWPGFVAECIRAALASGFTPAKKGPTLVVPLDRLLPDRPWPPNSRTLRGKPE
jgi:hypothetical protein